MEREGTISPNDRELILFTDSVDEAMNWLKERAVVKFGLRKLFKPVPLIGER
jgi:hypothetical protein